MRRRAGFTLVEVLVAMALTLFIMSILSAAFVAATQSFTDLKSAGDLAEKLRGAANVLKRDLGADHIYSDTNGQSPIRLNALWQGSSNQPPPQSGFFRIFEGAPSLDEGTPQGGGVFSGDLDNIHSYIQTTTSLHYTIGLSGNKRSDFLSAYINPSANPSPLLNPADATLGPPDQRYEDTPSTSAPQVYSSQYAEVAVFLVPTGDQTDGTGGLQQQNLYALYRRQFLPVPNNWPPTPTPPTPPVTFSVSQLPNYFEMSTTPTAGEASAAANMTFNSLSDLSKPVRRFWMNRSAPQGAFQPPPSPPALLNPAYPSRYETMAESSASYAAISNSYKAADLLLTDVVSFDVRVLVPAVSPEFIELCTPATPNPLSVYSGGNPAFNLVGGPMVFDTWTNQNDALTGVPYAAAWNNPWQTPTPPATAPAGNTATIPLYQNHPTGTNPSQAISIQAIQITLRVWDFKTKKTRQVTIVQQM